MGNVVREMLRKADGLAELPHLGRVVPELNDPQLREIPAYSWRILCHLRADNVRGDRHPQAPRASRPRPHPRHRA